MTLTNFPLGAKTIYSLVSLIALSVIGSCSTNTMPTSVLINSQANFKNANLKNIQLVKLAQNLSTKIDKNDSIFIADIGNGKTTGASITFSVDIKNDVNKTNKGLSIKSSSNGYLQKTVADVKSYHFWLIHSSSTLPTGNITSSIVAGSGFDFDKSAGTATITYSNVDKNLTGEKYYIAAAAYDNTIAATAPARVNIVNLTSGTTISGANVFISNTGGEGYTGVGTGNGAVFVNSSYGVSDTNSLIISLKLLDALGATLDSTVSVSAGDILVPATTVQ
ncbi:MAG: hypothetical protein H7263_16785 [Candidatus Sericytochromatia bacterium]|nr:hypothetical protein [Candidatus Sericytochromatia bacterium]